MRQGHSIAVPLRQIYFKYMKSAIISKLILILTKNITGILANVCILGLIIEVLYFYLYI